MENLDIWHKFEKQGGKVLHTIRTRDTATAKACMAATQLLDCLYAIKSTIHFNKFSWPLQQQIIDAISKAEGE